MTSFRHGDVRQDAGKCRIVRRGFWLPREQFVKPGWVWQVQPKRLSEVLSDEVSARRNETCTTLRPLYWYRLHSYCWQTAKVLCLVHLQGSRESNGNSYANGRARIVVENVDNPVKPIYSSFFLKLGGQRLQSQGNKTVGKCNLSVRSRGNTDSTNTHPFWYIIISIYSVTKHSSVIIQES